MRFQYILLALFAIACVFAQLSDDESAAGADMVADAAANSDDEGLADTTPGESDVGADVPSTDDIPSADDVASDNNVPSTDDTTLPSTDDITPADDSADAAGENSDDYGEAAGVDAADGENSDDYGEAAGVDSLDAAEDSTPEEEPTVALDQEGAGISSGALAGSLVGGAAVVSAGVLLWVKRSNRAGLDSIRSQVSMA